MNIRPFEIVLIGVFVIFTITGLIYLSQYKSDESKLETAFGKSVVVWGTLDEIVMNDVLSNVSKSNKAVDVVTYRKIDSRDFNSVLLNAIADGKSPDLILLPSSLLVTYRSKIRPISFQTIPERTFRDTYIDGADIFLRSDGIYGLPFAADPLVMYWNKDIFSSSGLAQAPKTWETLLSQSVKAIVRTDEEHEITQSAVAFGEYANVEHAKKILAMLLMQSGSNIVEERNGKYAITVNENNSTSMSAVEAVLTFYSQFVIPEKEYYSWNRSKESDRKEFLNGTLGMYFAPGSEKKSIDRDNPNLNYASAPVPQGEGATIRRDFAEFYAFAIPRAAQNSSGAYAFATYITGDIGTELLAKGYDFAPTRRSLYVGGITDPHKSVVYESALISHSWLDPAPRESSLVFQEMVENISSGRVRLRNVVNDMVYELQTLFE